jgi:hypothetical protein
MAVLSAALPYVAAASTVLTTAAAYQQSNAQETQLEAVARAREEEANAEAAESQRAATIERRKARNLMSRARAVSAASGAGASDPTVVNQLADIETQGELNALNAMYSGSTAARGYRRGAAIARNEADATQTAGYLGAASTALEGASDWYSKYGGKKKYGT